MVSSLSWHIYWNHLIAMRWFFNIFFICFGFFCAEISPYCYFAKTVKRQLNIWRSNRCTNVCTNIHSISVFNVLSIFTCAHTHIHALRINNNEHLAMIRWFLQSCQSFDRNYYIFSSAFCFIFWRWQIWKWLPNKHK